MKIVVGKYWNYDKMESGILGGECWFYDLFR